MADQIHTPVLLERTLELLAPAVSRPGAVVVDCTLGMGGHSEAMLQAFPELTVVGLDRDTEALALAGERLAPFGERARLVHTTYDGIAEALDDLALDTVDGVLFDLGVSSLQLDRVERGFSYSKDAPLDMRMDPTSPVTAERVLAEYPESELRRIFYQYGEEKLAPRYARRIVEHRADSPLTRSGELVDLLIAATPMALQRAGHPAKRVFQALRIEVNGELASLEAAVPVALDRLAVQGRIVVLAYQSLEDRFVKRELAARTTSTAPQGLPVELPEHRPDFRLLVRGAELASDAERDLNPRAKPVRLRAAERIRRTA
ncbi:MULTISPECIES: 16S rRNA (cytosine(1402)-N(4))-methyltransferase RsmH [unclassified Frigoribacterium]|jgi:16S rRNA (cytosine1402-N4)-methyltransferase|uniref:16S rRNA (cytosine(1402)-N(4))-methyltransferase RsmH n=1 Tax=unclassified Frigoribacterium TaxID=2627005 RepID=UPI0005B86685|nr:MULTISPECIES: 16S rRNA (cytosine(1402)-N(4))-methyltransferase RsmH [unclassified Frigoribacterium]KIU03108.1 16S rRNA methyltransferase [Frigoribacterium sp. MEB024]KQN46015.1 ribosomal RNA small subunit methyltransferase H [Frigoribacterium sp. Leaf44]MBD8539515.1 16S rRNA (cytosine(1402)-N(4))-methyltransferase RsmH [Frigoribacterium sp. CFBP 8751]